jgi:hypothetical protein
MGNEGLTSSRSISRLGADMGEAMAVRAIVAVIFFKSTSIFSCLTAIRPSFMLSCTKLSLMALKEASVVVIAASIASKSNRLGKKIGGNFSVGFGGRNLALDTKCNTPLLPEVTGA